MSVLTESVAKGAKCLSAVGECNIFFFSSAG